jgi:hypothetical protein
MFPFQITSFPPVAGSSSDILKLCPGLVPVREREAIHAPGFRLRVNFAWLYESAVDLKSLSAPDANYLPANARVRKAAPPLFVYRGTPSFAIRL